LQLAESRISKKKAKRGQYTVRDFFDLDAIDGDGDEDEEEDDMEGWGLL
jgi:hypothetical protein